jgi:hypothetical protein
MVCVPIREKGQYQCYQTVCRNFRRSEIQEYSISKPNKCNAEINFKKLGVIFNQLL